MKLKYVYLFGVFLVFFLILQLKQFFFTEDAEVSSHSARPTIILDAGHGGEDGGAVSVLGTEESRINLAITLKLEQLLLFYGTKPLLLREDDRSLHDESCDTIKEKKSSDLKNRVEMVNQVENGLLISIHQNAYPEEKYSGAQVFYTETAQEFAVQMQEILKDSLNPDNNRASKPVDAGVYLMNHVTAPALLIECGFLSNYAEAELLGDDGYQTKVACAIATGLLRENVALI